MNKNNRLIIAAAGSGKTTLLVNEAMKIKNEKILFTTYTDNNADEIKQKFISKCNCIPELVTIQPWFSFLIQHGARPYQGSYNEAMFEYNIKSLILLNEKSGYKHYNKNGKPIITDFAEEKDFKKHFFDNRNKIFSDKLAKFVFKANKFSNNEVINRITRIYSYIFIDEAQDLAGYDLDIIKLLLKKSSNIVLTADPRQATYSTHREVRNQKYKGGKIRDFLDKNCKNLIEIDYDSLNVSHRNNQEICDYSSLLYPKFPKSNTCTCCNNNISHNGIFLLRKKDIETYMHIYNNVIQLRWNRKVEVVKIYSVFNFGESKGKTFERVLIYPAADMKKWIVDNKSNLKNEARAKFYVAITRAKYSVTIVVNDDDIERAEERGISFEKIYDDVKREVQLYKLCKKNF